MKISSFLFVLAILFASVTSAQVVTGHWYGVGKVKKAGDHNSYLSEMVLVQKGKTVTGQFSYFFRSDEIKTKITGTYDPKFKVLELNARPILNFQAKNANGADCPMEGSFTFKVKNSKKTLSGQFNPTYDYRITCPAIDITFTKYIPTKDDSPLPSDDDDTAVAAEVKKPVATKAPEKKLAPPQKSVASTKPVTSEKPGIVNRPDSVRKAVVTVKPSVINKPLSQEQKVSMALKERTFDVSPVIEVDADSLKVSLYDNGDVDNDTISVFYNRKLVASKQMLSDKPLAITLPLDTTINEISMFAENLGKIPPNTALAIIYAGEQRFELNLTSTYSKNAAIRFRRKAKHIDPKNIN